MSLLKELVIYYFVKKGTVMQTRYLYIKWFRMGEITLASRRWWLKIYCDCEIPKEILHLKTSYEFFYFSPNLLIEHCIKQINLYSAETEISSPISVLLMNYESLFINILVMSSIVRKHFRYYWNSWIVMEQFYDPWHWMDLMQFNTLSILMTIVCYFLLTIKIIAINYSKLNH